MSHADVILSDRSDLIKASLEKILTTTTNQRRSNLRIDLLIVSFAHLFQSTSTNYSVSLLSYNSCSVIYLTMSINVGINGFGRIGR
jgi:hypothetical protein